MRISFLSTLLLYNSDYIFSHKCVHDQLIGKSIEKRVQSYPDKHPYHRRLSTSGEILMPVDDVHEQEYLTLTLDNRAMESLYAPIRITLYYDNESMTLLPPSNINVIQKIMSDATTRISQIIQVIPVAQNLSAQRACDEQYVDVSPTTCKTLAKDKLCLEMPIPASHFAPIRVCRTCFPPNCGLGSSCEEIPGDGIPNSDYVLYVRAHGTDYCQSQVLAYATACQKDQFDRPTFGMVNFCPHQISDNPRNYERQLSTALHEITHALGFSGMFYAYMRHPDGTPRTSRDKFGNPPVIVDGVCPGTNKAVPYSTVPDSSTVIHSYERGQKVAKLVTPKVAAFVRNHFNCSSLMGAELESFGESLCIGSHWEERLFESEYMSPISSFKNVISGLTLAFFEDSGWYKVNYSMSEALHFGADQGCAFVTESCIKTESGISIAPNHYCTDTKIESCTLEASARSVCPIITADHDIPPNNQYFLDNPRAGGNEYADYCPVHIGTEWGDCTISENIVFPPGTTLNILGETYCSTCKCTHTTLRSNTSTDWSVSSRRATGCYQMSCTPNRTVEITIPFPNAESSSASDTPKIVVSCPDKGVALNVTGYSGELICPDPEVICDFSCPRACSGNGRCEYSNSTCICDEGWYGSDCGQNTTVTVKVETGDSSSLPGFINLFVAISIGFYILT